MVMYRCTKCGNTFEQETDTNQKSNVKIEAPSSEKESEKKCCPSCGAECEFWKAYEEDKEDRYD